MKEVNSNKKGKEKIELFGGAGGSRADSAFRSLGEPRMNHRKYQEASGSATALGPHTLTMGLPAKNGPGGEEGGPLPPILLSPRSLGRGKGQTQVSQIVVAHLVTLDLVRPDLWLRHVLM